MLRRNSKNMFWTHSISSGLLWMDLQSSLSYTCSSGRRWSCIALNSHLKCNEPARKHWMEFKPMHSNGNRRSTSPRSNGNGYVTSTIGQHCIKRTCSKRSKRALRSWNTSPARKYHQRKREDSSLERVQSTLSPIDLRGLAIFVD